MPAAKGADQWRVPSPALDDPPEACGCLACLLRTPRRRRDAVANAG